MMNKKYGVLVHGAGWVATQRVQAFLNNSHAEVVAISIKAIENYRKYPPVSLIMTMRYAVQKK